MSWDSPQVPWNMTGSGADTPQAIPVITAVLGSDEPEIAHLLSLETDLVLVRRCMDLAELVGAVQAGIGAVAIVSSDQIGFDRNLLASMQAEGVALIAVNDPMDQLSAERMNALGVKYSVASHSLPSQLVDLVRMSVAQESATPTQVFATTRQPVHPATRSDGHAAQDGAGYSELESTIRRSDIDGVRSSPNDSAIAPPTAGGTTANARARQPTPDGTGTSGTAAARTDRTEGHGGVVGGHTRPDTEVPMVGGAASSLANLGFDFALGSPEARSLGETQPNAFTTEPNVAATAVPTSAEAVWSPLTPSTGNLSLDGYQNLPDAEAKSAELHRSAHGMTDHEQTQALNQRGRVITVWSGHGAPGRSTVSAGLAVAMSQGLKDPAPSSGQRGLFGRLRKKASTELTSPKHENLAHMEAPALTALSQPMPTILLDADTYAPSQAQALGLLDESSGLAVACRSANQGVLTSGTLKAASAQVNDSLALLTGLPNVSRWTEIGAHSLEAVVEQARKDFVWTIIDCAPPADQDEMLSFDTRAPQRNAATLTALSLGDLVVIVGKSDPIGIKRLVSAITEFKDSEFGNTPFVVVVNQAPTRVSGKDRRSQIEKALKRFAGEDAPVFIPFEPKSATGSLEIGRAITEHRRKGEIGSAIISLGMMIARGFDSQTGAHEAAENPISRVKMLA